MKKQNNISKIIYFVMSVSVLMGFNLYTSAYLSAISQDPIFFLPGVKLNYMENTGAAFSILQNYKVLLIIFAILAIIGILYYLIKNRSPLI